MGENRDMITCEYLYGHLLPWRIVYPHKDENNKVTGHGEYCFRKLNDAVSQLKHLATYNSMHTNDYEVKARRGK